MPTFTYRRQQGETVSKNIKDFDLGCMVQESNNCKLGRVIKIVDGFSAANKSAKNQIKNGVYK